MPEEYDVVSKVLLLRSTGLVARTLFGGEVAEWLSNELPNVRNPRADAVVRRVDGCIAHVELQAKNDPEMAERMFDYYGALRRRFKCDVPQAVLYLGADAMRMPDQIVEPKLHYEYRLIDIASSMERNFWRAPTWETTFWRSSRIRTSRAWPVGLQNICYPFRGRCKTKQNRRS